MRLRQLVEQNIEAENAAKSSLHDKYRSTGWNINSTVHARSQAVMRHPDKSRESWEEFHRNVVHGLAGAKEKNNGMHVIYSASHEHGVVAHVDRKKKHVNIVTVLPKHKDRATHEGDSKLTVESFNDLIYIEI